MTILYDGYFHTYSARTRIWFRKSGKSKVVKVVQFLLGEKFMENKWLGISLKFSFNIN